MRLMLQAAAARSSGRGSASRIWRSSGSAAGSRNSPRASTALRWMGFFPRQAAAVLPKAALNSLLLMVRIGSKSGLACSGSGCNSALCTAFFPLFLGQTCWQVSQPYSRLPIGTRNSSGIMSLLWVQKDKHRLALSCRGPAKASVGQASRQRVQSPQPSPKGVSGGNGKSVIISPR
ncbi:hypothetical protein D3C75_807520 [compost metagenome]